MISTENTESSSKPTLDAGYDMDSYGFEEEDLGGTDEVTVPEKPFDPKKVDVSIQTPNMGALIARLKHSEIDLMPDFQRSADLWSKQAQSRLIESILIRLPIPAFYFDVLDNDVWQVVDGLQRLSAISNFVLKENGLRLTNLEFLNDYEGFRYNDLPRVLKRRIDEFQTSVYLIKPGTPLDMKYSLFNRINTGGLKLTNQEIRHALSQSVNSGIASKFLRGIAEKEIFHQVVGGNNARMAHQELVLRHMAFVMFGSESYKSSLPKFLDSAMTELGIVGEVRREELSRNFLEALQTAHRLFGDHVFKKTLAEPDHKKVINKPLFESVSVCLALISQSERKKLEIRHISFRSGFIKLLSNSEFHTAITRNTANTENVQTRFRMVGSMIEEFSVESND